MPHFIFPLLYSFKWPNAFSFLLVIKIINFSICHCLFYSLFLAPFFSSTFHTLIHILVWSVYFPSLLFFISLSSNSIAFVFFHVWSSYQTQYSTFLFIFFQSPFFNFHSHLSVVFLLKVTPFRFLSSVPIDSIFFPEVFLMYSNFLLYSFCHFNPSLCQGCHVLLRVTLLLVSASKTSPFQLNRDSNCSITWFSCHWVRCQSNNFPISRQFLCLNQAKTWSFHRDLFLPFITTRKLFIFSSAETFSEKSTGFPMQPI